jgi:hypothetical protein
MSVRAAGYCSSALLTGVDQGRKGSRTGELVRWVSGSLMLRYLVAACCVAAGVLAGPEGGIGEVHSAVKLDAAYTASLIGIPIGQISWTIELSDKQYTAAATGSTIGLLRVFANGRGAANAHGMVDANEPVASDFVVKYVSGSASDEIRIAFSGGKAKESLTHPPRPDPSGVPLTDANRVGVVDPMTALLIRVPGNGDTAVPAACERKIAVFDGHMRYDLQLAFKRIEQVRANAGYQGPAVVCAVYFSPLAGYDIGRSSVRYLKEQRGMEMWLAPIAGTRLLVPFRVLVPTPIGLGILQATRFVLAPEVEPANATNAH